MYYASIKKSLSKLNFQWWPGGLGRSANYAVVMAQLVTQVKVVMAQLVTQVKVIMAQLVTQVNVVMAQPVTQEKRPWLS